jgi:DNA-binding transcriptional MerR regulator
VSAELVPIGKFARATGLSIGALRHYDEIGLLIPAAVDTATGYRYYSSDQFDVAAVIATLRELEVPLPAIASMMSGTRTDRDRALSAHLARTEAAATRLQRLAHRLRAAIAAHHDFLTDGEPTMPTPPFTLDPDDERRLAATLFNHTWELLEKPQRSVADDDEMIHSAHASRYHWGVVGTPVNYARGEWQCSRVYSVLGRSEPALHHASRCLALSIDNDLSAFDIGCGHEALARAYRVAGRPDKVREHLELADVQSAKIVDAEDRKILDDDLDTLR